jgi:chemosensory pili system protein ChpA (sensor histidine kinase/response regulator)
MVDIVTDSLHVVGDELAVTLNEVRLALEQYAEGESGPQALERCMRLLHTAQGVLRITETHGASLLAEEMEATCAYLARLRRQDGAAEEAIDALSRAAVQLPAYVERVRGGGRDMPLVLLPLLNDLRAARGKPLLSESTLLLLNVLKPAAEQPAARGREISGEDLPELCRKQRPRFQLALLGWIRGDQSEDNARRLYEVAEQLARAASDDSVHQLWWVVTGVVEALSAGGLDTSVALKRLLGQADREMKRLRTIGESAYAASPPTELVNNLLYYIARASTTGPVVSEIRAAFNLDGLVPDDDQVEAVRESLGAPSAKLMGTVAEAIKEDLARVKDVLDIYVRTGMEHVEELAPQVDLLKKISDTLGVLGLGESREIVQSRRNALKHIIESGGAADESTLVEMAADLLSVEDRLDEQLLSLIRPVQEPGAEEEKPAAPGDADYAEVTRAVMRESIVNLARVKDAISQVLEHPSEGAVLDTVPQQLRGITAGLLMLQHEPAVGVVEGISGAIRELTRQGYGAKDRKRLDMLADAIVSLEYYLETIQAGRREPSYMLDNALRCLSALQETAEPAWIEAPETEISSRATTVQLPPPEQRPQPTPIAVPPSAAPPMASGRERLDPELLELFIEEAGEEIDAIKRDFPQWAQDEGAIQALMNVRRSFHTLKGSGRMVGAELIGEFCWSIENLLNRVINKTVERTSELVAFLGDAVNALPDLLEQLEVGTQPQIDIPSLMAAAAVHARGRAAEVTEEPARAEEVAEPESTEISAPEQEAIEPAPVEEMAREEPLAEEPIPAATEEPELAPETVSGLDPVLLEILTKEVAAHLAVIREFLDHCDEAMAPFEIPEELYRACHTLHGSVTMAKVDAAAAVTGPLNRMVRHAFEHLMAIGEPVVSACAEAVDTIEALMIYLRDGSSTPPETTDLTARLAAIDAEIEAAAAAREAEGLGEQTLPPDVVPETLAEIPPAQPPPIVELPPAAFDPEIVAIFSDEAAEILESVDGSLASLPPGDADSATLAELQRCLHTLKGGARMAGLTVMGDLSHELETLLNRIAAGQIEFGTGVQGALQASVDELHRLREQAVAGVVDTPPPELVARLQDALSGQVAEQPAEEIGTAIIVEEVILAEEDFGEPSVEFLAGEVEAEEPAPEEVEVEALEVEAPELEEAVPVEPETEPVEPEEAELELEAGAEAPTEPSVPEEPRFEPIPADLTASIPALEQIGQLARELEEPARPAEAGRVFGAAAPTSPDMTPPERREVARVDAEVLEHLLNSAGEISIFHSRLSQQISQIQFNLEELGQTVVRLRDQLRNLELATEAQILYLHQSEIAQDEDFDPLELDRYSRIQQLSRALAETASDVSSLKALLQTLTGDAEALLVQQARTATELQDGLMRTRMVPFQQHAYRLARLVRQTATENGKQAELSVRGGGELDRQVLEKMLPPFEHMLRNAVIHGIETPADRQAAGKPAAGNVTVDLRREGSEVAIEVIDDGRGLDVVSIKRKAVELGLVEAVTDVTDEEAMQLILRSGFSTADRLTQAAGRGIGMDVVANEITKLGGTLRIDSTVGQGTSFTVRLPFTLAVTQALIVRAGHELYALPLPTVEGIIRISCQEFEEKMAEGEPSIEYGGQMYSFRHLGQYLNLGPSRILEDEERISIILVKAGENSTALITDEMLDSREIVVKPVGDHLSSIRGISGATILGDGRIVVILDVGALVRSARPRIEPLGTLTEAVPDQPLALVVDDSITMRRVTQRLLERHGMRVVTAKDGVEAIGVLEDHRPDIILLDIEMPRMDGYEFATHVRSSPDIAQLPIIMVTSRVSDKHRARAIELGVNDYLGKPYQENELLDAVNHLLNPV